MAKESGDSQLTTMRPYLPKKIDRVLDFGGGSGEAARLFLPISNEVFISEMDPNSKTHIKEEPRLVLLDGQELFEAKFLHYFDLIIFCGING